MSSSVLTDGFPTIFGFGETPESETDSIFGILACEKRLKPFGIDGGGPNDTTCMRNTRWRTRQAKKLATLTDMTLTVSYDPVLFEELVLATRLQFNQIMFLAWPDGSVVNFWGFLDTFEPHEVTEGSQPEADMKVCPTNQDDTGAEVAPTYTADAWTPQA